MWLPDGVARNLYCMPQVTLADCDSLQLFFEGGSSIIVQRRGRLYTRPVEQAVSELRPGSEVIALTKRETITRVEIYQ